MRRVLVLNLSRMGDIVQSVPFLGALKRRPDVGEVHLLVEKAFVPVTTLLPHYDRVHVISHDEILPPLNQSAQMNPLDLYRLFERNIQDLREIGFDEVWNLTHTRPSMILTRLIGGENSQGVTVDAHGFQMVRSKWLRYFFATNLARPYCQFNLVDIYAQCAGPIFKKNELELIPEESAEAFSDSFFSERKLERNEPVAMQLGAAHISKRWPVEYFQKLAQLIRQKLKLPVILLGHESERGFTRPFEGLPGVISLVGKTTIPQLFSILRRCRALVSNDTGTIHLAAGVGLPILALTLGTALGSETAPFGEGHIVIEPDIPCFPCSYQRQCHTMHCHSKISIETAFNILSWMLNGRDRHQLRDDYPGARIYETIINTQDQMLELRPLAPPTPSLRDQLHALVRPLWRCVLGVDEKTSIATTTEPSRETAYLKTSTDRARPLVTRAIVECERMRSLSREKSRSMENLWRSSQTLTQIDKSLEANLNSHALLRSFWWFTALTKASIENHSLEEQIEETLTAYTDLEFLLNHFNQALQSSEEISILKRKENCHESLCERV